MVLDLDTDDRIRAREETRPQLAAKIIWRSFSLVIAFGARICWRFYL